MPAVEGSGLALTMPARGLAIGDLFNDGKIDAVINVEDHHPVILKNVNPDHHHWVELRLIGGPSSPRDAVGATVFLTSNHVRQRCDVLSGGSYISSSDQRLHFGLGDSTTIDAMEIHWPDGKVERPKPPEIDRIVTITEGGTS